jgi:putative endonuclease
MISRSARGRDAEGLAAAYLEGRGFRILDRNVRTFAGELDLVAEHAGTLVFVEVRSRSGDRFGSALESVDGRKRARLTRAALAYAVRHRRSEARMRFDVIGVEWRGDGEARVDHVENAFAAGE